MKTYRVTYDQTETRQCLVNAESEEEARALFAEDQTANDRFVAAEGAEVADIEEV